MLLASVFSFSQNKSVDTTLIDERIQTIQSMLSESKTGVDIWWYGWLGTYSVATLAQGTVYFVSDNVKTRQDMVLGAGTTFLGAAFQLLTPLNTGKCVGHLNDLADSTVELKLKKLQIAEEYLRINAAKEQEGRSWKIHALNTAVNLGSGLITWLGFRRTLWDGVSNFLINSAVTELQIWTQPTRTQKDYVKYQQQYIDKTVSAKKNEPEYALRAYPGGLSLSITF